MYIMDRDYIRPPFNKNHLRLYGHHLCPFVEKARLVLAAKGLKYQDVQVNLERRTKWHYMLNEGFVPILEVPGGYTILESKIIMDYLE
jgi:glutathione S-transferase